MNVIHAVPTPDLGELPPVILAEASAVFHRLQHRELKASRDAGGDETRREIDQAVVVMLDLGEEGMETVEAIRRSWCEEISVQGGLEQEEAPGRYDLPWRTVQRTRRQRSLWLSS